MYCQKVWDNENYMYMNEACLQFNIIQKNDYIIKKRKNMYLFLKTRLPWIPNSLFLRGMQFTSLSLEARNSLFCSDNKFRCSNARNNSNGWLIPSAVLDGMTSSHRNLSFARSAFVISLEISNKRSLKSLITIAAFTDSRRTSEEQRRKQVVSQGLMGLGMSYFRFEGANRV